jgi:hypothetical protein
MPEWELQVRLKGKAIVYLHDVLNHLKSIKATAAAIGGSAVLDASNFWLTIHIDSRRAVLYPQFVVLNDGHRSYTSEFSPEAIAFNGWYPALNKFWEVSGDKLQFKSLLLQKGIRTPKHSENLEQRPDNYIVKHRISSFGDSLRGPFRAKSAMDPDSQLKEGEYFEEFVFGWIAKAWFWNARPVCLQLLKMPAIVADGTSTVGELLRIEKQFIQKYYPDDWLELQRGWGPTERMLDIQGLNESIIVPAGHQVLIDYRYNSPWLRMDWGPDNVLPTCEVEGVREQLEEIGGVLWEQIPEPVRNNSVFTVDAILDVRDSLWFLEVNSNPQLHPDVYPSMLKDICAFAAGDSTLTGTATLHDTAAVATA